MPRNQTILGNKACLRYGTELCAQTVDMVVRSRMGIMNAFQIV